VQLVEGRPVYAATDLVAFLACNHLLALERAALAGLVKRPVRNDPSIDLIAKRGLDHEQRYLAELRDQGLAIVEIAKLPDDLPYAERLRAGAEATRAAMASGADVIFQATFFDGTWLGYADFLLRVERASDLGPWSYEVADTKLARRTKASAVLQICSYVDQLSRIQNLEPRELHVVLGGSRRQKDTFRVADFMAYYRRVKAGFEAAVTTGEAVYPVVATYPEPVEHCDVCRWAVHCRVQRRQDDDLSLVAGISARQRNALKDRGVSTRRGLAALVVPMSPRLERVSGEALERVQAQARIQVEGEDEQRPKWELLDPEREQHGGLVRDRGFLGLPPPSGGDLFFDIEGDPFAMDDGVEYLFGIVEPALPDPDDATKPRYHEIWSREASGDVTLAAEKTAFEALVDLLIDRLDADPAMHVYHYAAYERTALGKLAQRHATREAEVDRLLRGGVLVDLYRVVRQGVRASVESYSIKRLEPLYELEREVDLRSAGSSIVAFEAWLEGATTEEGRVGEAILREIAGYNRDDVLSNWRLRDWLEERRLDLERKIGEPVPRPVPDPLPEGSPELKARETATLELVEALTLGVPADPAERTPARQASWLLAQLLGWHRREDKAFWWRFFQLCAMTDEDLVDEREPMGSVEMIEELGVSGRDGRLQRFRYPPQDHGLKVGRGVIDPRTKKSTGTVQAIDEVGLTVVLHRTRSELDRKLDSGEPAGVPGSLIPDEHIGTPEQEDSLLRIGRSVAELGIEGDGPHQAARDLLLRNPPRLRQGSPLWLRLPDETAVVAATRLGLALEDTTLAIQGPPGSGKTYTAAEMIVALVRAGRRVGVTANSHKVIGNALDSIEKAARRAGVTVRLGQRTGTDNEPTCDSARPLESNPAARTALEGGEVDVVGGTAWLWSRPEFAGIVDVLFVDEAGQLSLANAVSVSPAGRSLVLLGDPQQLDQPLRGTHPAGAEQSALGHLLDGKPTIPDGAGLFLERTWRLHPDICDYTSEVFYAGELLPQPELANQDLHGFGPANGTGLRWVPVKHDGDATESEAEADTITALVGDLLAIEATWTTAAGEIRALRLEDIVVVAPYNAHAELIADTLARAGLTTDRVGTVDKFQGQEAPISIYAMATSSAEEAPRGLEFLYSRNRLNVATSRARCVAIVVASPDLVRVQCHTPHQMTLANALCRLVELASGA
jgi:predicted RecB family nuclease